VVGSAGKGYTIIGQEQHREPIECVLSVDGLDVLDGKTAAFTKRGILDARGRSRSTGSAKPWIRSPRSGSAPSELVFN
jgi:hypothetical protein